MVAQETSYSVTGSVSTRDAGLNDFCYSCASSTARQFSHVRPQSLENMKQTINEENPISTSTPDWAVAPGEILAEELKARGMSETEFAYHTSLGTKHVNQLIKRYFPLSAVLTRKPLLIDVFPSPITAVMSFPGLGIVAG